MQPPSDVALVRALSHPRFEIVPVQGVEEQICYLPAGAKVTVTCSPTRGIERTVELTERLAKQGLPAVPHLSARLVRDRAHLQSILHRLAAAGAREVFVIGGDAKKPAGSYSSALDLLNAMAGLRHEVTEIGVAAYPERHPLINGDTLRRALHEKQSLATYLVTQICFNPEVIVSWLAGARRDGITLPAYIGLPGVVDRQRLLRISMKIGVGDSTRFLARNTDLATRLLKSGSYRPTELVETLAAYLSLPEYDLRGFHLNTFNQVDGTERWRQHMLKLHGARNGTTDRAESAAG